MISFYHIGPCFLLFSSNKRLSYILFLFFINFWQYEFFFFNKYRIPLPRSHTSSFFYISDMLPYSPLLPSYDLDIWFGSQTQSVGCEAWSWWDWMAPRGTSVCIWKRRMWEGCGMNAVCVWRTTGAMAICQAQMSYPRNSCIGSGQWKIAFLIQRTCQRPPCHTRNTAESANCEQNCCSLAQISVNLFKAL